MSRLTKHAAPIAFRETQRDFKRYAAVIAATSVEDVKVGDYRRFLRYDGYGA
jgi:hypothetical protein